MGNKSLSPPPKLFSNSIRAQSSSFFFTLWKLSEANICTNIANSPCSFRQASLAVGIHMMTMMMSNPSLSLPLTSSWQSRGDRQIFCNRFFSSLSASPPGGRPRISHFPLPSRDKWVSDHPEMQKWFEHHRFKFCPKNTRIRWIKTCHWQICQIGYFCIFWYCFDNLIWSQALGLHLELLWHFPKTVEQLFLSSFTTYLWLPSWATSTPPTSTHLSEITSTGITHSPYDHYDHQIIIAAIIMMILWPPSYLSPPLDRSNH